MDYIPLQYLLDHSKSNAGNRSRVSDKSNIDGPAAKMLSRKMKYGFKKRWRKQTYFISFSFRNKQYALNQYNKLLSIDRKCAMRPGEIFTGNYFIYFMLRNKEIHAECK